MPESNLLHELVSCAAERDPRALALTYGDAQLSYGGLAHDVQRLACGLISLGLARGERVAIYLEKRIETVTASFGACAAGGVFVPLNPLLKPEQAGYILNDCQVRILITSPERLDLLRSVLADCPALRCVVLTGASAAGTTHAKLPIIQWAQLLARDGAGMRTGLATLQRFGAQFGLNSRRQRVHARPPN